MNLKGFSNELKLLHYFEICIHFDDHTCDTYSKVTGIFRTIILIDILYSYKCCPNCVSWSIEYTERETKLWSVFNHLHAISCTCIIFLGQSWDSLELSPAHRHDKWISVFENMRIPSMLLYFDSNLSVTCFLMFE